MAFLPYGAVESIRRDVDLSYLQAGFLLALYPGIGVLTAPVGVLADRVSRRWLAGLGGVGYGVGLLLFAVGGSFPVLVAAVVVMGVAGDALVRAVEVALVDVTGDQVEPALARSNLLGSVGDLLGPLLLAAALATGLGWRAAFAVGAVAMIAYGLVLASQPFPPPGPVDDDAPRQSTMRTLFGLVTNRRVLGYGLLVAVLDSFDEAFLGFVIAFLTTDRGVDPAVATLAAGAGTVGGLVGAVWASRARRRSISLRFCSLLLLAGVVVLLAVPLVAVAALAAAAIGFAVYLAWITVQARYLTMLPGQAGATSAVVGAIGQVAVLVPLVFGVLADHTSLTVAMLLYLVIAVAFPLSVRR